MNKTVVVKIGSVIFALLILIESFCIFTFAKDSIPEYNKETESPKYKITFYVDKKVSVVDFVKQHAFKGPCNLDKNSFEILVISKPEDLTNIINCFNYSEIVNYDTEFVEIVSYDKYKKFRIKASSDLDYEGCLKYIKSLSLDSNVSVKENKIFNYIDINITKANLSLYEQNILLNKLKYECKNNYKVELHKESTSPNLIKSVFSFIKRNPYIILVFAIFISIFLALAWIFKIKGMYEDYY